MNKKNQTNENINNWKFSKEIIEFIDSLLKIYCKIKNNSMYLKVSTNYWNISFVKIKDWVVYIVKWILKDCKQMWNKNI